MQKPLPSPAILSIDIPELVRVREVEISDTKRGFYATCRDGGICYVTCWKDRVEHDTLMCHKPGHDRCEGVTRVAIVLNNERYRRELLEDLAKITDTISSDERPPLAIVRNA